MKVIVVDNGSGDGTVEMVRGEYPEVELHANESNLGFSAATNIGIRAGDATYVLALNPDTRVTEGALEKVTEVLERHGEVAVAGPSLVREDGTPDHAAKRSFPTPLSALGHFTGAGRRPRSPAALSAYRAPGVSSGRVDAVNGAFMLMRRSALDEVGGFDEGYWMYMEDLDLSYRLAQAGWSSWYEPGASVVHVKGASAGRHRSLRLNLAFHGGMRRFYRDHYAPERSPLLNAAVYAGIGLKLAVAVVRSAAGRALEAARGGRDG